MDIIIATDGSCIGNPGPGAFAMVADVMGERVVKAHPFPDTTVGGMEVRGLLEALLFLIAEGHAQRGVLIKCDAQYVVNGYNDWMAGWEAKGWNKKGGLAHAALWKRIAAAKAQLGRNVRVEWVRAHQVGGCPLNAAADNHANNAARLQRAVGPAALQLDDSSDGQAVRDAAIIVTGMPKAPPVHARPTYDDLVALLRDARDQIDHLRTTSDSGSEMLSARIGGALEHL